MSTTKKIAHNTIIQLIGKIISTFLGLIAIGMMTRYLGQEQFGWYTTAIYFLQFVGILIDFGMIPVTAQMLSEGRFEKTTLFQNIFTFRLVTACLCLATVPFVILLFPYTTEIRHAVSIITISFIAIALNQVATGLLQYKLNMHIQAIAEVMSRIVLVVGLWAVIKGSYGFLPLMWVITVASIAHTAYLLYGVNKIQPLRFSYDRLIWKAIMVKMWPIAISIIFNVMYLKGDAIILSLVRSASEVGLYGAAYRVIDLVSQTAMLLMGLLLPLLGFAYAQSDHSLFSKRYQQSFDGMMMMAIPMVAGLYMLATPIMTLVAGAEFSAAGVPLQILSLAIFGLYLGSIFGHVAVAIDQQKKTMWIYILGAGITLIGYLYFIPRFGMLGAAWMSVFSELLVGVLLFIVVHRILGERLSYKTFFKVCMATALMCVALWFFAHLHTLMRIGMAIAIYAVVLYALGGIKKQTLVEIFSRS